MSCGRASLLGKRCPRGGGRVPGGAVAAALALALVFATSAARAQAPARPAPLAAPPAATQPAPQSAPQSAPQQAPRAAVSEVPAPVAPARPEKELRSFSLGLYTGIRPDMASLGSTIAKDGTIELSSASALRAFGGTKNFVMGDKDDQVLLFNSRGTNSGFEFLKQHTSGGPLTGLTVGFEGKYDFNDREKLPLFVRVAVDYTFRLMGGAQSRTLGRAIDFGTPLGASVRDVTGGTEGAVLQTTFSSEWWEVPLTVGFSIPIGPHRVYAGIGGSYFNGNFSVRVQADDKYVKAATTLTDGNQVYAPLETQAVDTTLVFSHAGMAPNFMIGAEAKVGRGAVFLEFQGSGAAETRFSTDLGPEGQRLLTAMTSSPVGGVATPYASDPQLLKRIAFPVVLGGAYFRLGYRFYMF